MYLLLAPKHSSHTALSRWRANQKKKMRHGDKDDVTKEEDPLEKLETFHHEILQTAVKECADLQAQVLNFFGDSEYGRELRAALEESDTESDSD